MTTQTEATALLRLREIEHLVWHLLDDSEQRDGEIICMRSADYEELCKLLPEDHPRAESKEQRSEAGSKHQFSDTETDRHLLVAYTPTRYAGDYPEYFNLTMLRNNGSVILVVRLPTVFGAPEGETSSVRFDARTWREFVRLFPEAIKMYDAVDFLDGQM